MQPTELYFKWNYLCSGKKQRCVICVHIEIIFAGKVCIENGCAVKNIIVTVFIFIIIMII